MRGFLNQRQYADHLDYAVKLAIFCCGYRNFSLLCTLHMGCLLLRLLCMTSTFRGSEYNAIRTYFGRLLGWHSKVLIEVQIRGAGRKFLFLLENRKRQVRQLRLAQFLFELLFESTTTTGTPTLPNITGYRKPGGGFGVLGVSPSSLHS